MDLTHLHLMITHLPIYGSILGSVVLAYGMLTKSNQTKIAGYIVLFISSVGGTVAFATGEAAEETVEKIQGIGKNLIEQHEEFATVALAAIITTGILSFAGLLFTLKKWKFAHGLAAIVLMLSLACFGITSWTGYLGGQIRHTEISNNAVQAQDAHQAPNDD